MNATKNVLLKLRCGRPLFMTDESNGNYESNENQESHNSHTSHNSHKPRYSGHYWLLTFILDFSDPLEAHIR